MIALHAGAADDIAEDDLVTGIRFLTSEPVNTEVLRVNERSPVVDVFAAVDSDLPGNGRGVLAQILTDITERIALV